MTHPRKSLWDKCDHSPLCVASKCDDYTQTLLQGSKWHSQVQIISWMNASFRPHYSDLTMHTQQTYPTTNWGIWRNGGGKKFLSLSWHDKSVCISTPFITSHPRQWIGFQKPINKGDVHSAWQLSQTSVPLSFAHPSCPPSFPSSFSEISRKRKMKIKSGEGELGEKKGSRGDEKPSCSGSSFIGLIKERIKARGGCVFFPC